jgi:GH15 family glucan-1,4-alpha-glucosidase
MPEASAQGAQPNIEDYALLGDLRTAALVSREGSVDWLCCPRFDSPACFSALLGSPDNGRWLLRPAAESTRIERRYRDSTLVLETDHRVPGGAVRVIDFMPRGTATPQLVRIVEGLEGEVAMRMQYVVRFDYGSVVPWVRRVSAGLLAVGGPDSLLLHTPVRLRGENFTTVADFSVRRGERIPFVLSYHPSNEAPAAPADVEALLSHTEQEWSQWSARCAYRGPHRAAVLRSLLTLKALSYAPTGGIVAAPTTSLPEAIGGVRNWDYRYCWLRDAAYALYALLMTGYREEAAAWRDWLLRAAAGRPQDLQIVYGLRGERRLLERELPWLAGYRDSRPVRIGNGASRQHQLDVYGEVMDVLYLGADLGIDGDPNAWQMQKTLMDFLETSWDRPDHGVWEVRGPQRHFTHSKVMAWRAFDRAVRSVTELGLEGPLGRWRGWRTRIHEDVCRNGYDPKRGAFVQYYGGEPLDASLLIIPLVGFLPADDPRMAGTTAAVGRELMSHGLVRRYAEDSTGVDGLPPGEGFFLPASFLYADNLALQGRLAEAEEMFARLLGLCNDLGLQAEEYDPLRGRMLGNFPQALTHVAIVNTAITLERVRAAASAAHAAE